MRTTTLAALALLPLAACSDSGANPSGPDDSRGEAPGTNRRYGAPVQVGAGRARSYVLVDQRNGGRPLEIGVALDERALDALPAPAPHEGGAHHDGHEFLLPLPAQHGTPYQLVEMNWNPSGHEPAGVYDAPHFDFHFYTISKAERDAITPADPAFATKAANLPQGDALPGGFMVLPPPPAPVAAVPKMGVHWSDLAAPELQRMLGNPTAWKPFTHTFIYGSWDGRFIFAEPMITRDFLLTKPDVALPVAAPVRQAVSGWHPTGYRITWDAGTREYRVALTGLTHQP